MATVEALGVPTERRGRDGWPARRSPTPATGVCATSALPVSRRLRYAIRRFLSKLLGLPIWLGISINCAQVHVYAWLLRPRGKNRIGGTIHPRKVVFRHKGGPAGISEERLTHNATSQFGGCRSLLTHANGLQSRQAISSVWWSICKPQSKFVKGASAGWGSRDSGRMPVCAVDGGGFIGGCRLEPS